MASPAIAANAYASAARVLDTGAAAKPMIPAGNRSATC